MTYFHEGLSVDGVPVVRIESDHLQIDVAPSVGGRIVNLTETSSGHQFLWHNPHLKLAYAEYDSNFYGAIDELIPNDIPESINGVDSPDHGELWTMSLDCSIEGESLILSGRLPLCGLQYEKHLTLRKDEPVLDVGYRIQNTAGERREFLWKLHAALSIDADDRIICPARTARVVDTEWSRWSTTEPFAWPQIEGQRADLVPPKDDTMDFLFIYDLEEGHIAWRRDSQNLTFEYRFDVEVFPYAWYFASFGGFDDHYMAILEPCTTMPLSVSEAAQLGQCSVLEAGESIETTVTIYAGPIKE